MHRAETDVLVVGGGVTGCAAAYYLAQAGADVTLVERYDLNTQASGRNAGSLHGQIQHEAFLELGEEWAFEWGPTLSLLRDSIDLWRGLPEELGADLEVDVCGGLLVAATDAQLRDIERKAAIERSFGVGVELLSRDDLQRVAPYVSGRMAGALLCEVEGKANPLLAVPALARAAADRGARLLLETEVHSVERRRSGFGVETTAGTIDCGRIVDCGGAEAAVVSKLVGVDVPVERWPIQMSVTEAVPPLVTHLVYFAKEKLTLKQAKSGSLLIGGGWPSREDDSGRLSVDVTSLAPNLRLAIEVVPQIAGASLLRTWAGVCPGIADWRPVIGEAAPGFFVALFPFLGFTGGPLLGKIVAQLALGEETGRDLAPFSPVRF
ncbi:MAG: FAD-binding oxidoreductase [Thermoleophilia bacterium]|nr:FAD-binding oxidoreductase [Thermoleophilia bacterium]